MGEPLIILLLLAMAFSGAGSHSAGGAGHPDPAIYSIDAARSQIEFTVRHLGLSIVRGRFSDVSGTLEIGSGECPLMESRVKIQAESVRTDGADRDKRMLEKDFLDAGAFPLILFAGEKTETADADCSHSGWLQIKDIRRQLNIPYRMREVPADLPGEGKRAASGMEQSHLEFTGEITFNRNDFNLHFDDFMDNFVGDTVTVKLLVVAVPVEPGG
jgi:polyisoprenoid-binding protein YceI